MERNNVSVKVLRAVDHDIASGVWDDMTQHCWKKDDWPIVFNKVMDSDILVIGSPIWLGQKSSVCQQLLNGFMGNQAS